MCAKFCKLCFVCENFVLICASQGQTQTPRTLASGLCRTPKRQALWRLASTHATRHPETCVCLCARPRRHGPWRLALRRPPDRQTPVSASTRDPDATGHGVWPSSTQTPGTLAFGLLPLDKRLLAPPLAFHYIHLHSHSRADAPLTPSPPP